MRQLFLDKTAHYAALMRPTSCCSGKRGCHDRFETAGCLQRNTLRCKSLQTRDKSIEAGRGEFGDEHFTARTHGPIKAILGKVYSNGDGRP
jgi:hypothetical protein